MHTMSRAEISIINAAKKLTCSDFPSDQFHVCAIILTTFVRGCALKECVGRDELNGRDFLRSCQSRKEGWCIAKLYSMFAVI